MHNWLRDTQSWSVRLQQRFSVNGREVFGSRKGKELPDVQDRNHSGTSATTCIVLPVQLYDSTSGGAILGANKARFIDNNNSSRTEHSGKRNPVLHLEWGYLILLATLLQSTVLGVMLVLAPLLVTRRHSSGHARPQRRTRFFVFVYFLALGIGFMFVEMALIQRLVFFLASPVYAVAIVLAGLLLVSGLGSRWAALQVARGRDIRRLASMAAICSRGHHCRLCIWLVSTSKVIARRTASRAGSGGVRRYDSACRHGHAFSARINQARPGPCRPLALGVGGQRLRVGCCYFAGDSAGTWRRICRCPAVGGIVLPRRSVCHTAILRS